MEGRNVGTTRGKSPKQGLTSAKDQGGVEAVLSGGVWYKALEGGIDEWRMKRWCKRESNWRVVECRLMKGVERV